jgi:hypothetical protein
MHKPLAGVSLYGVRLPERLSRSPASPAGPLAFQIDGGLSTACCKRLSDRGLVRGKQCVIGKPALGVLYGEPSGRCVAGQRAAHGDRRRASLDRSSPPAPALPEVQTMPINPIDHALLRKSEILTRQRAEQLDPRGRPRRPKAFRLPHDLLVMEKNAPPLARLYLTLQRDQLQLEMLATANGSDAGLPEMTKTVILRCQSMIALAVPNAHEMRAELDADARDAGDALTADVLLRRVREMQRAVHHAADRHVAEAADVTLPPDGQWSAPMSKAEISTRLKLSRRSFNTFTKNHALRSAGNRQLWQIRLDGMDAATRKKVEG